MKYIKMLEGRLNKRGALEENFVEQSNRLLTKNPDFSLLVLGIFTLFCNYILWKYNISVKDISVILLRNVSV